MIDGLFTRLDSGQTPAKRMERAVEKPTRDFRESVQEGRTDQEPMRPDASTLAPEEAALQRVDTAGQASLLPWQLVANNALSHLFASPLAGMEPVGACTTPAIAVSATVAHASGTAYPVAGGARGAGTLPSPVQGAAPATSRSVAGPSGEGSTDSVGASAVLSSLAERWQQRLLRWSSNSTQGLSVRIRDYRLDAQGQQALADRLIEFASRNGLALQRIVINARELWHAGAPVPPHTGDSHGR